MVDKKDLLKELEKKFEETKKELGFQATFEELETEFSLTDSILSTGFVSEEFSRQLCMRIVEPFRDWHGYLNNLLMPNPGYYASQTESKLFNSEEDKKNIWDLIKLSMKFSSMHSVIGFTRDKSMESTFIDESFKAWKEVFSPGLKEILKRIYEGWKKE